MDIRHLLLAHLERTNRIRRCMIPCGNDAFSALMLEAGMEKVGSRFYPGPRTLDWIIATKFTKPMEAAC